MANPSDIRSTLGIKLSLGRKNGQDLIRKTKQLGGAAIAKAPSPFLGSDVIGDRQRRAVFAQPSPQPSIRSHVVDQYHRIGRALRQQAIHLGLQPQGGQNQRNGFPETDRAHWSGVGNQLCASRLHPGTTESQDL